VELTLRPLRTLPPALPSPCPPEQKASPKATAKPKPAAKVKAPAKPKETTAAAKKKAAAASIVDDSDDSDAGGAMQVDATDGETDGSPEKKQPLREIGGQAGKGKDNSEMYQKVRCWTKGLGKDLRQEPD
jgi:hypothetical protein